MINLEDYNYHLPEELIRKRGVEPRDSARLFVYDTATDTVTHALFRDLPQFLPEKSVMVLNNTKVVPARLFLKKETGGKIEVFVLANEITDENGEIPVLVDRKCSVGWKLYFPNKDFFEVVRQDEKKFFVTLKSALSLHDLLDLYGETPIPHYLEEKPDRSQPRTGKDGTLQNNENEIVLRKRYQTIFAQDGASVAAPTASLHFTEHVFIDLHKIGTEFAEVTLNVGLGTFSPLKEENFQSGKLHSEKIFVSPETADAINLAKEDGRAVVAIGTTALRTIESASKPLENTDEGGFLFFKRSKEKEKDRLVRSVDEHTDIFIYPPYQFRAADILVTNFHLPKSSLMLLTDAFLSHKQSKRSLLDLYAIAIKKGYSFYSFGDSMLIL